MATEPAFRAALRAAYRSWDGRAVLAPDEADGRATSDAWMTWQERAAAREEGDVSRAEAERLVAVELGPCPPVPKDWGGA